MESMLSRKWKTINGVKLVDPSKEIAWALRGEKCIYVGTDSQHDKNRTQFVTVLVIHNPGHGARAFYTVESQPRIRSLRERLLKEVWMSVQFAIEINDFIDEGSKLEVHVDANPNTKFKSSAYVKELSSLVVSQGFACMLKPDAWAAMHVADKLVKEKVVGR